MKWYKHLTDSHSNLKFQKLLKEYGLFGYGMWWVCCEVVGKSGNKFRVAPTKWWKQHLLDVSKWTEIELNKFLEVLADSNLISKSLLNKGFLAIPKMTEYADEYSSKVATMSRQRSDNVVLDKTRLDKIRLDKNTIPLIPQDITLAQLLFDLIKANTPNWYLKPKIEMWADEIRKLREIDHQTLEEIEKVIRWCQADDFWKGNILSTTKLRKQFPTLLVKMGGQLKMETPIDSKFYKELIHWAGKNGQVESKCGNIFKGWIKKYGEEVVGKVLKSCSMSNDSYHDFLVAMGELKEGNNNK